MVATARRTSSLARRAGRAGVALLALGLVMPPNTTLAAAGAATVSCPGPSFGYASQFSFPGGPAGISGCVVAFPGGTLTTAASAAVFGATISGPGEESLGFDQFGRAVEVITPSGARIAFSQLPGALASGPTLAATGRHTPTTRVAG